VVYNAHLDGQGRGQVGEGEEDRTRHLQGTVDAGGRHKGSRASAEYDVDAEFDGPRLEASSIIDSLNSLFYFPLLFCILLPTTIMAASLPIPLVTSLQEVHGDLPTAAEQGLVLSPTLMSTELFCSLRWNHLVSEFERLFDRRPVSPLSRNELVHHHVCPRHMSHAHQGASTS
jgi:hypothetical protein